MNTTLGWLYQNSGKVQTPDAWATLLNVAILDDDGWRNPGGKSWSEPIGLVEFINRLAESTTMPVDHREVDPRYPAGVGV